jgi:ABC-type molybdate transport system ATPase subunit
LLRYLRNQKKVVALIESGEYVGHKYNEMLKLAHDRVLLEEAEAKKKKEAEAKKKTKKESADATGE